MLHGHNNYLKDQLEWSKIVTRIVMNYIAQPLIVINILGNVLNIFIFTRKRFRKISVGFYLCCLSITDMLEVYILVYYIWMNDIFVNETYSGFMTKFKFYLVLTVQFYSPWMSMLVSLDRCVVALYRNSVKLKNRKLQLTLCLFAILVLSLINIPVLIEKYVVNEFFHTYQLPTYYTKIYPFIDIVMTTSLPFLFMCISNFIIVIFIKFKKREMQRSFKKPNNKLKLQRKKSRMNKISLFFVVTLSLNLLFAITHTPISVLEIWSELRNQTDSSSLHALFISETYRHYYLWASIWRHLYAVFKFVMYLVSYAGYRSEVVKIFKMCCSRRRRRS